MTPPGQVGDVLWTTLTAFIGIAALAGGVEGWCLEKTTLYERVMLIAAGLMWVYLIALYDLIGSGLMVAVVASQKLRRDEAPPSVGGRDIRLVKYNNPSILQKGSDEKGRHPLI